MSIDSCRMYLFGLACSVSLNTSLAVEFIALQEHGYVTIVGILTPL